MGNPGVEQKVSYLVVIKILILVAFGLTTGCVMDSKRRDASFKNTFSYTPNFVTHIVDGDTFDMTDSTGKLIRIRPIGINTDEMRNNAHGKKGPFAQKAKDFLSALIYHKRVRLETDIQRKDQYGRVLAYVFVSDTLFVNAELLRQGLAVIETHPPNLKYVDLFYQIEQTARNNKAGMWLTDDGSFQLQ